MIPLMEWLGLVLAWFCVGLVVALCVGLTCYGVRRALRGAQDRWRNMRARLRARWVAYCERVVFHDRVKQATKQGEFELYVSAKDYRLPKERRKG